MKIRTLRYLLKFICLLVVAIMVVGCSTPTAEEVTSDQPEVEEAPTAEEVTSDLPEVEEAPSEEEAEVPSESEEIDDTEGTIVVAYAADLTGFDPHEAQLTADFAVVMHLYDRLWEYPPEGGDLIPKLAESWEFNDDQTELTIKLREGVMFHDGTPFNAEAAKFNLDRLGDDENPVRNTAGLNKAIASTEVIDEYTVKVIMAQPFPPFFRVVGRAPSGMMSPTAYEKWGEDFASHPVGTGPFKFKEWVRGQSLVIERNEDYWDGAPPADAIQYIPVPESSTRIVMVEAGDAHIADKIPYPDIDRLQGVEGVEVRADPSEYFYYVSFYQENSDGETPFADERVRLAVNYAVDKEGLVNSILRGYGTVADSPIGNQSPQHCVAGTYEYDPEKAVTLLEEAGYPDGFKTSLITASGKYPMAEEVAETIQAYLAAVGIELEIITLDTGSYGDQILTPPQEAPISNPGMVFRGWSTAGALDAGLIAIQLMTKENWPPAGFNVSFYYNERVEELVEEANSTWDEEFRQDAFCEVQQIVFDDVPWLFLYSLKQATLTANQLQDVVIHPGELVDFRGAWIDTGQ